MHHSVKPILSDKRRERLCVLQKSLGVSFSDISLLNQAFIHSSFTGEHGMDHRESNQRLEFLGDSVIYIVAATYLYKTYPDEKEGFLTEKRIALIREGALVRLSDYYNLGSYLLLSKGGLITGIAKEQSVLADTFEALIGAMYLDLGFDVVYQFFIKSLKSVALV